MPKKKYRSPKSHIKIANTAYGEKTSLDKLNQRQCKWPIGDPKNNDFGFCGADRKDKKNYCQAHCEIAYTGIMPKFRL